MRIGYARILAEDRNPELQIEALKDYGCERIFTEADSGVMCGRPELIEALGIMHEGDEFVVWKLSRLGHSLKQLSETMSGLEKRNIGFVSLTEEIDTNSSEGKMFCYYLKALVMYEREIARERVFMGVEKARKAGRKVGPPKFVNKDILKRARKLLKNPNFTGKEVAKMLNIHVTTLYRYIPKAKSSNKGKK